MNELKTQHILSEARSSMEPTQADRDRVRRRVMAAVGIAALTTGTAAGAAKTAGAGGIIKWLTGAKTFIALALIGATTGLVIHFTTSAPALPPSTIILSGGDPVESAPRSDVVPVETPTPSPLLDEAVQAVTPAAPEVTDTPSTSKKTKHRRPAAVPATVEKPNDTSLFKEIRMIKEASMALSNNAPAKTLQILSAYDKAFPNGAMRQERDGLRVLALCALNRNTQADREKARFLKKSPDSPMARRIKASCQSEEKSE